MLGFAFVWKDAVLKARQLVPALIANSNFVICMSKCNARLLRVADEPMFAVDDAAAAIIVLKFSSSLEMKSINNY